MRLSVPDCRSGHRSADRRYGRPASAQMFEDQSPLFGRRHGYVYEGPWCAREDIGGGSIQEDCTSIRSRLPPAGDPGQPRLLHAESGLRPADGGRRREEKKHRRAER